VYGYSVIDRNYPTLARLVSEMNGYTEEISSLRCCADMAVRMVHRTHESIKDAYKTLTVQVPCGDIAGLSSSVHGLLASIQSHSTAVEKSVKVFECDEVRTLSYLRFIYARGCMHQPNNMHACIVRNSTGLSD
jgi:hypothetical protein